MKTITVLVNDLYPGTPNPLMYVVEVEDPEDEGEVMEAVRESRLEDIGDGAEPLELELLLAFTGDLNPIADWRG